MEQDLPLSAALLHDVMEDTSVKKDELYNFLVTVLDPLVAEETVKISCRTDRRVCQKQLPQT